MTKPLSEVLEEDKYDHPDSARHREMSRRLRKLDERHQPRYYDTVGGGRSIECAGCKRTPPCPDRRILDGEES